MNTNKLCSFFICLCVLVISACSALIMQNNYAQSAIINAQSNQDESVFLPIIMYHSLLKNDKLQNDYTISPDVFENDLKFFTDNGYTTITVKNLTDFVFHNKSLPPKCIMLTFDDGYYNNYFYAYPLLKKYKCKAIFSPIVCMTEKYTEERNISVSYGHISVSDIKEMLSSGCVEIQNHSYNLHKLSPRRGAEQKRGESDEIYEKTISEDIVKAQNYLEEKIGVQPDCFIYPFGAKSSRTIDIIKKLGFVCTMDCTEKPNRITHSPDSLYELGRYRRDGKENIQSLIKRIEGYEQ